MNAIEALQKRKSVRGYTNQPVEEDKLKTILKYGNMAPNVGPFHMSVIINREILSTISDTVLTLMKNSRDEFMQQRASLPGYTPLYNAPVLILLSAPQGIFSGIYTACAVTNMTLAATELGLGSCFIMSALMMFNNDPELCKQVGVPEGYTPQCGMIVGYESENQIPGRPRAAVSLNINYVE